MPTIEIAEDSPMIEGEFQPVEGGCTCGHVRYLLEAPPLIVHCCHCRWCQRETGSAFVINALIETDRLRLLSGEPRVVDTPSESGKGQKILRCPICHIAVWSHYAGAGYRAAAGHWFEEDLGPPNFIEVGPPM
jgi:hypothetical protein